MRILIDENLPKRLKLDFREHQVFTVRDKFWNGIKNGELLQLMIKDSFDVFLTYDKNMEYQQNFLKYPVTVFVLNAEINQYKILTLLTPKIKIILNNPPIPIGPIIISNK